MTRIHVPTIAKLTESHRNCNPFIQIYKTAREQLINLQTRSTPVDVLLTAELRLIQEAGADRRRENLPTATEVDALIPDLGPGWHKRTFRDMHLTLRRAPYHATDTVDTLDTDGVVDGL